MNSPRRPAGSKVVLSRREGVTVLPARPTAVGLQASYELEGCAGRTTSSLQPCKADGHLAGQFSRLVHYVVRTVAGFQCSAQGILTVTGAGSNKRSRT